ncbi:MAG TPA: O-antigen ligase family protein [Candidatus Acidoferrales bacterium]|nr:O-antigen ligase family protein [Candidatus Acidoferrales bacterium]
MESVASGLPFGLLFVCIPVTLALALWAPPCVLLFLALITVAYPGEWQLAGVHLDINDLLLAGMVVGLLRPRIATAAPPRRVPYLVLWLALGVLRSVAYYLAPVNQAHLNQSSYAINQDYLVAVAGIGYQIYRYCWRLILFYPLTIWLLDDRRKFQAGPLSGVFTALAGWLRGDRKKLEALLLVIVLSGAACAAMTLPQGFAGDEATGPFLQKNILGGALVMPFLLALWGTYYAPSRRQRCLYAVSLLLIARALLFAGSRGAFVAILGSVGFLLFWFLSTAHGRSRILRVVGVGAFLGIVMLGLKPDLFERPSVQVFFSIKEGAQADTLQWRMRERWPYFWQKAMDNFWLGIGTDVDPSLGDSCITPHNGYLGMAVVSGIPSVIITVLLALLGLWNGMRAFLRSRDRWQSTAGLAMAAALVGLLVHNMVDETIRISFAEEVLWITTAAAATLGKRPLGLLPMAAGAPSSPPGRPAAIRWSPLGGTS